MLQNVLIVKLANLETVNFKCLYFSALYTLLHVLIVKLILVSCILIQKQKKKKTKKQTKNDPYFSMGKNIKVMPQNAPLSISSLIFSFVHAPECAYC